MEVIRHLMDYLIIVIECLVWWRFISSVLEVKYHKKYTVIAVFGFLLLQVLKIIICNIPDYSQYNGYGTLIISVYTLTMVMVLFKNSLMEKLIWWGVFYFGLVILEMVTMFLLKLISEDSLEVIIADPLGKDIIFLCKLLLIPLFEIIIRSRKGKLIIGLSYHKELTAAIVLNIVLMIYSVHVFYNKRDLASRIEFVILFIFGIMLFIMLYMVILIFRLEKNSKKELAMQLKLQQTETELRLYEDIVNISDRLRKLRHDMNNHVGIIKTLVNTKRYDELEEYIDQIYEDVEVANELVITGNKTLSVIINAKKTVAKSKNIDFSSVITTKDINMRNKDLCSLLGNILDNAIEAAEKTPGKKYIDLMIQRTEEGCIISCENSMGAVPVTRKERFITTKENALDHGIGIENIKEIVSSYRGQINFDYDDNMFNVKVIMPV